MTSRGPKTNFLHLLFWLSLLGFILQQVLSELRFNAPPQLLVIQLLPLVIFLPGIARDNLRSFVWLSFVVLAYFVSAILALFARSDDGFAIAGVALLVMLFMVIALYIRYRGRELSKLRVDTTEPSERS
jgi:uncharacterized membrane protein